MTITRYDVAQLYRGWVLTDGRSARSFASSTAALDEARRLAVEHEAAGTPVVIHLVQGGIDVEVYASPAPAAR